MEDEDHIHDFLIPPGVFEPTLCLDSQNVAFAARLSIDVFPIDLEVWI